MLTQEEIQKIQNLLQEIQNKKEALQRQSQNLEVEIKLNEQQIDQLKSFFKEKLGTDDINKIEDEINKIEDEIKEWIENAENLLNEI